MSNPLNRIERSAARQAVDEQIHTKYNRLKWYQRSVGAICLLLGGIGGYLDNKQVASGELHVPAMLVGVPLVAAGSVSAHIGKRRTRRSCDRLVAGYAKANNVEAAFRNFRTESTMRGGQVSPTWTFDQAAQKGELYDDSHSKAIRFASPSKEACAYIGGFGLNGFLGNFHMPPEFVAQGGSLGVASAGTGVIFQVIEEASVHAHRQGYEAQLNNIDAMAALLPPPQA